MVFLDDTIHIYVDFVPVVSTSSADDALALVLALYAILELNFNKNARTIRLIYAVVFGDKRFLSNTIRHLIQEKGIDIYLEKNRKVSNNNNLISTKSTSINSNSQSSLQDEINQPCSSIENINCLNPDNPKMNMANTSNE